MSDQNAPSYLCRGDRKNTWIVFLVFLGVAVFGILAWKLGIATQIVGQTVAFIAVLAAVYIFVRYIGTAYRYDVIWEEEEAYLLIVRVQGKKQLLQQKLPLAAFTAIIEVATNQSTRTPKPYEQLPTYNYSAHLLADTYCLLRFQAEDKDFYIRMNADEAFLRDLSAFLPQEEQTDIADSPASSDREDTEC